MKEVIGKGRLVVVFDGERYTEEALKGGAAIGRARSKKRRGEMKEVVGRRWKGRRERKAGGCV
jgi:hypothetical protein